MDIQVRSALFIIILSQQSELATCRICKLDYSDPSRSPLLLPCGHSACEKCLQDMFNKNSPTCPSCHDNWSHARDRLPVLLDMIAFNSDGGVNQSKKYGQITAVSVVSGKLQDTVLEDETATIVPTDSLMGVSRAKVGGYHVIGFY